MSLEDDGKDFFSESLKSAVTKANAATVQKLMTEAIGLFVKKLIRDLEIKAVHPATMI